MVGLLGLAAWYIAVVAAFGFTGIFWGCLFCSFCAFATLSAAGYGGAFSALAVGAAAK